MNNFVKLGLAAAGRGRRRPAGLQLPCRSECRCAGSRRSHRHADADATRPEQRHRRARDVPPDHGRASPMGTYQPPRGRDDHHARRLGRPQRVPRQQERGRRTTPSRSPASGSGFGMTTSTPSTWTRASGWTARSSRRSDRRSMTSPTHWPASLNAATRSRSRSRVDGFSGKMIELTVPTDIDFDDCDRGRVSELDGALPPGPRSGRAALHPRCRWPAGGDLHLVYARNFRVGSSRTPGNRRVDSTRRPISRATQPFGRAQR